MNNRVVIWPLCLVALGGGPGCGGGDKPASAVDDAGHDGGFDVGRGAGREGAPDGGWDAGPCVHGDPAGELLWTTLDDAMAVLAPRVGDGSLAGIRTMPHDDFEPGVECSGVRIDEQLDGVGFGQAGNIDFMRGTADFWYKPDASHRDGANHIMFATSHAKRRGGFICRKAASDNMNSFQVLTTDASGAFLDALVVPATEYAFAPDRWVHIRVTWDFTVGATEQSVRVYFDGIEPTYSSTPRGPATMPTADPDESIFIGTRGSFVFDNEPAVGVFDEFRIWDAPIPP